MPKKRVPQSRFRDGYVRVLCLPLGAAHFLRSLNLRLREIAREKDLRDSVLDDLSRTGRVG